MDGFISHFVHQANLTIYRRQLAQTTDAARRQQLLQLLAEEERKGAAHDGPRGDHETPSEESPHSL
jgi:hypothetical protein